VSFVRPVSTFEEDVTHCLTPKATLAFIGIGLVDGMEVSAQADLACAYLCNDRADRSVRANMWSESSFSWPHGTKRQRGDKHCKIHLWGSHEDKDCIVQHPELEAEWRKKYPGKAKARDEKKARRDATVAPASPPASQTTQAKLAFVSISDNKF
jgi:hypothetical protein